MLKTLSQAFIFLAYLVFFYKFVKSEDNLLLQIF